MLPELIVNRHFMAAFIEAEPPCVALGMVEIEASLSALIALRFNQPIPKSVMAGGFAFGHSMLGSSTWEVVHLAFQFYGFATYNALLNPSNPAARSVLTAMVQTGGYFVFALDSDRSTTAFRSDLGRDTLAGLRDNMAQSPHRPKSGQLAERRANMLQNSVAIEPSRATAYCNMQVPVPIEGQFLSLKRRFAQQSEVGRFWAYEVTGPTWRASRPRPPPTCNTSRRSGSSQPNPTRPGLC